MQSSTYVFVLRIRSEVYVSEARGKSINSAMLVWGKELDAEAVTHMNGRIKSDFLEDLRDEHPTPIRDRPNVWMFLVSSHRIYGHVYSVKAAESVSEKPGLYSFIVNFEGGEYISQIRANSVHDAVLIWGRSANVNEIENFDAKAKESLLKKIRNVYPNAVAGAANAWAFDVSPLGRIMQIAIIKTSEEPEVIDGAGV